LWLLGRCRCVTVPLPQSLGAVITLIVLAVDLLFMDEDAFVFEPSFRAWQKRTGTSD
jgi:hypothetical protein